MWRTFLKEAGGGLTPGEQKAEFESICYEYLEQDVKASLHQPPPEHSEGTIVRFVSTPANAEVQVDGQYWGSTPTADLTRLPAGEHTILVKKVGYQSWERRITLQSGDDRTISAELEIQPPDPTKSHIAGN